MLLRKYLDGCLMLMLATLLSGCGHFRHVAISESRPLGGVQTRNRYRLFQFCVKGKNGYVKLNSQEYASMWSTFKSSQPNVFADDGKPIGVYLDYTDGSDSKYAWTVFCPYILSICTLPFWDHKEWRSHYSIRFQNPKKVAGGLQNSFSVKFETDWNMSFYTPSALLFGYDTPISGSNGQPFYLKQTHMFGSHDQRARTVATHSAVAHGAACTLKRMEEAGTLPDIWEKKSPTSAIGNEVPVAPVPSRTDGNRSSPNLVEIDSIPL